MLDQINSLEQQCHAMLRTIHTLKSLNNKKYPTKLIGKVTNHIYTFKKEKVIFNTEEEALEHQLSASLLYHSNYYTINNDMIYLYVDDIKITLDYNQLDKIKNHYYSIRKNHVVTYYNGKIKLVELLTNYKNVVFINGDQYDYRLSNIKRIDTNTIKESKSLIPKEEFLNLKQTNDYNSLYLLLKEFEKFPRLCYDGNQLLMSWNRLHHEPNTKLIISNAGSILCLSFMCEALYQASGNYYPTPDEVWQNKLLILCKTVLTMEKKVVSASSLYKCYGIKFYKPTNFSPLVARNLYDYYFKKDLKNKRVLDPCAGYGGRLLGFWASKTCQEYVGIDPNSLLTEPYNQLIGWLRQNTGFDKKVTIIKDCAESVDLSDYGLFDIIFTSPPYFNVEKYSDEVTQSYIKYNTLQEWVDQFLIGMITNTIKYLKPGGIIAINIKQVKRWKINVIDCMSDFLTSLKLKRQPDLFMAISARPGSNNIKTGESIYIFQK